MEFVRTRPCRDSLYGCPAFWAAIHPSYARTGVNPVPTRAQNHVVCRKGKPCLDRSSSPCCSQIGEIAPSTVQALLLAKKDTKTLIEEELERQREYLDALPPDELQMVFQDIVISSEVEAEFLHNPIVNKTAEYSTKLRKSDIALPGFSYEYLQHPEPPSLSGEYPNADELRARIESINKADQVGCRYTLMDSILSLSR